MRLAILISVLGLVTSCGERQVDAYYYPDRSNLKVHKIKYNVGSVEACRDWVYEQAAMLGDPSLTRGDYECGIGPKSTYYDITVYEETVR